MTFSKAILSTNTKKLTLNWFWASINEDDVYPKDFLEYIMELADDAKKHPEKLVSFDSIGELISDLRDE
jgi:hypothetical protein